MSSTRLLLRLVGQVLCATVTLVVIHFLYALQMGASLQKLIFVYLVVAVAFGYDLRFRVGAVSWYAPMIAASVGILATMAMSLIVSVLYDQAIFPDHDQQQLIDFGEIFGSITLGYWAGYGLGTHIALSISAGTATTTAASIHDAVHRARLKPLPAIAKTVRSLEGIVKALVALVLAIGTLAVAIKKLLAW
jgi:hypothetical protein